MSIYCVVIYVLYNRATWSCKGIIVYVWQQWKFPFDSNTNDMCAANVIDKLITS